MNIKIDKKGLSQKMKDKGIKNYKELAILSGIPAGTLYNARCRAANIETLWMLSECLECSINEIVYADWEE